MVHRLVRNPQRGRANEIVAASGVNDTQQFIETTNGVTFREQTKWFFDHAMNRKRKRVKPSLSFRGRT
jgi:hypothetical protein